ncbi:PREDICTED: protein msta-like [Nicrophorus vespilloides]|uniref:Protein msta-like n=1 Tax=Nicrophorus vespilloides TaxID=110193 RepID=A0ABM1MTK1_NICVS|nr:PREDICTED: protein msta-like [Nicrophorus vespilloides]
MSSKSHNHNHRKKKCKSKSRSQSVVSDQFMNDYRDASVTNFDDGEEIFAIKTSKIMGRYMVATRELRPGNIILSEMPIVVGPCTGCKVQCLACYQPIEESGSYAKCKGCDWPLCSANCAKLGTQFGHTKAECTILRDCKSYRFLDYRNFSKLKENFYCIVPLRCLMLKRTDPKSYEILMKMEHHNEIRKQLTDVWTTNQTMIVNRIISDWQMKEFSEDDVHRICGILEVNAFEIGHLGVNIRGLYPTAFLMSHNCIPNTNHNDDEDDFKLTVRASTSISINQPITLSYAYTLQSTLKRREHLLENKFFHCMCARCRDPTECGTFAGALRCPKCPDGYVLALEPLSPESDWKCNNINGCPGYKITAKSMELLINRISREIDALDSNDLKGLEAILSKYRNVLHPTHYLFLEIKLNLSQLYGKINGYLIHELDDEQLQRKMDICKEIIRIFDVIEPGFTRLRGVTLYELHAPVLVLTTRQFERQLLNKTQLRYRIKEVIRYLEEARIVLGYEPRNSPEGIMGVAAEDALDRMREWGKVVGRI